jgi:CTP:molybdopterin cytidylyltransferase MocA
VTVGLLLAAGAGRRFGGPKALATVDGAPLVVRAVGELSGAGLDPVLVVVGAAAERVATALPVGARAVLARDWAEGIGASLRAGLAAAEAAGAEAVLVMLVDLPDVTAAAHRRVLGRAADHPEAAAVQAGYRGRPGHPVLLRRSAFASVAATARGDRGARDFLTANPARVVTVDCSDVAAGTDLDTPEDFDRWASAAR